MNRWRNYFTSIVLAMTVALASPARADNLIELLSNQEFNVPGTWYFDREGGMSFAECSHTIRILYALMHFGVQNPPGPAVEGPRHLEFSFCEFEHLAIYRCVGATSRVEIKRTDTKCVTPHKTVLDQISKESETKKGDKEPSYKPGQNVYDGSENSGLNQLLKSTQGD